MFYDDWQSLVRVVVVGTCAYGALVVTRRFSGKRTLAKLNAFDFVVTVALGSTLATVLLSSSVALAEGVTALALLAGLQYLVARAFTRSPRVKRLVKSEPTLIYRDAFLLGAMRRERVTPDELRQAARAQGRGSQGGCGDRARDRRHFQHPCRPAGRPRRSRLARRGRLGESSPAVSRLLLRR